MHRPIVLPLRQPAAQTDNQLIVPSTSGTYAVSAVNGHKRLNGSYKNGSNRGRKVGYSSNPIANKDDSPIYALADYFQTFLHFPDPSPLYALMGAVAGSCISDRPIWLMMVGPPACGKTELLSSLDSMDRVCQVDSFSGISALLSGSPKKDRSVDATGGLLRQLGNRGCVMMKDFSSVLGTSKDKLSELIGVFKTLYDGNYNRAIGTDGGRKLAWKGKVMMLSACTNSIDDYHTMMAQMGERWVYFRYPESEGWQEALQAMRNREYDDGKESLSDIVKAFFDGQGIAFGPEGDESRGARALKYGEEARLIAMAGFLARSRGVVRRDDRTREIISLPTREMPARLAVIFQYMYLGMELIGMDDARERWKVIGKAVMDSMPLIRRRVIGIVEQRSGKGGATYKQIQDELVVSDSLVRRTVEDLESLGVLEVNKLFKHSVWLTPEAGKMRAEGWV